jgi:hypothetical protein
MNHSYQAAKKRQAKALLQLVEEVAPWNRKVKWRRSVRLEEVVFEPQGQRAKRPHQAYPVRAEDYYP